MLLLHQEFDLYAQVREKRYDSDQICGKLNVGAPVTLQRLCKRVGEALRGNLDKPS